MWVCLPTLPHRTALLESAILSAACSNFDYSLSRSGQLVVLLLLLFALGAAFIGYLSVAAWSVL